VRSAGLDRVEEVPREEDEQECGEQVPDRAGDDAAADDVDKASGSHEASFSR